MNTFNRTDHALVVRLSSMDWIELEMMMECLRSDGIWSDQLYVSLAGVSVEVLRRWDPYVEAPEERMELDRQKASERERMYGEILSKMDSDEQIDS